MGKTDSSLGLYAKHVLVGWAGLFFATSITSALFDQTPLNFLFGIPGTGPFFVGMILGGFWVGYLMNVHDRCAVAGWVFVLPFLWFLVNAHQDYAAIAPYGGWVNMWRDDFSRSCGASDCMVEAFATAPLYGAVAYSAGAWWARRHPPSVATSKSWDTLSRIVWRMARYSGQVVLSWSIAFTLAWLYFGLEIYFKLYNPALTVLLGPPVYLASIIVPAPIGFLMNRRQRRRIPCWVWIPPVIGLLVEALLVAVLPSHLFWAPFPAWRVFFNPGCGSMEECAKALQFAVPAYGAIAYSLGATLARRRAAAAAPGPNAAVESP